MEVVSQAQRAVVQTKVALRYAAGQGSLVLPATLPSGHYTVRAYTSWMKNFSPDLYFQSPVSIVNTRAPLGLPAVAPTVQYDPHFFPEGGHLVQGLTSKVGFKITDQTGRGVAAEGTVLDQAGATVAQFKTLRFGLGSFSFRPTKAGAAYTAVIRLAGQSRPITCALPPVQEQGYVLRLVDTSPTKLRIVVQTQGAALAEETLFLLGHARQQVSIAAEEQLFDGQVVFTVDKQKLAAGISHFTLFNSRRQPVVERLYFRLPTATLALTARTDQSQYAPRQQVALQLTAAGGEPLPAHLSVAVYQLDSLSVGGGTNITSYLWLTSDIKGTVENPDYYVSGAGPEVAAAADNLMLTQGWSRFRWSEVLTEKRDSLTHRPELSGHLVQGRVLSRTGTPVAGVPVYLTIPDRRVQFYNSVSRSDGSIQFEVPSFYGPQQLIMQTGPADSLHRLTLFNPFSRQYATGRLLPWTMPQRWAPDLEHRLVQAEVEREYYGNRPLRYQAPPTDSTAFYGQPNDRYYLDRYTRFKVMEEVLREYVPGVLVRIHKDGFHLLVSNDNKRESMENPLVLLDGMPVFNTNRIMAFDPLKVQRLDVVTRRYVLGPLVYNGLVSYTTYHGDLGGFPLDPHALLQEYEGLQGQRDFYAPRYETPAATRSRLPDFRNLLYWNPELTTTPGTALSPTFYTSDQAGTYRVVVQGLNSKGLVGSTSFTFEVKPAL